MVCLASYRCVEHDYLSREEIIDGKWVRTTKQPDIERLTQSTHAHLLTFAVLFALTGLTFAFTSYWGIVRCVLAPAVLVVKLTC